MRSLQISRSRCCLLLKVSFRLAPLASKTHSHDSTRREHQKAHWKVHKVTCGQFLEHTVDIPLFAPITSAAAPQRSL